MKQKITSIVLILFTLLIGFAAGFVSRKSLHEKHVKEMREKIGKKEGYIEYLKRIMELSPEQEELVQPILDDYAPRMHQHYRKFKEEAKLRIDSLAEDLSPHLSEKQIENLKKRFRKKRRRKKKETPPPASSK
ncbi:MAG: hypothetical protein AAF696_02245 [Bacteroidota bacterium]